MSQSILPNSYCFVPYFSSASFWLREGSNFPWVFGSVPFLKFSKFALVWWRWWPNLEPRTCWLLPWIMGHIMSWWKVMKKQQKKTWFIPVPWSSGFPDWILQNHWGHPISQRCRVAKKNHPISVMGITPLKINMEPKNWWFVDVSPFPRGYFQVPCLFSGVYAKEDVGIHLLYIWDHRQTKRCHGNLVKKWFFFPGAKILDTMPRVHNIAGLTYLANG